MTQLADLHLSDARIDAIDMRRGILSINITLWDTKRVCVRILDVIYLEIGPHLHEDLSHGSEENYKDILETACSRAEESPSGFSCYSLIAAWKDERVLLAVGRSWEITRIDC
jgi:hypothetical protein